MSKKKVSKASSALQNDEIYSTQSTSQSDAVNPTFDSLRNTIEGRLSKLEQTKKGNKNTEKQTLSNTSSRGKKRDANGALIKGSVKLDRRNGQAAGGGDHDVDRIEELHAIVEELGGTQEDLDFIQAAVSDSEVEGVEGQDRTNVREGRKKVKGLQDGIANILKEITLANKSATGNIVDNADQKAQHQSVEASSTKTQLSEPDPIISKKDTAKKKHKGLTCEPRLDWYVNGLAEVTVDGQAGYTLSYQLLNQLSSHAQELLAKENETFRNIQENSSSQAFYNTVIASGTLSDRISALTLAVQESPLHNVRALENLIGLAKKRSRAQALDVLRALKDLFAQGSLLPGNRKLYAFVSQPALLASFAPVKYWRSGDKLPFGVNEQHLISWAYEDWLKTQYFEVLKLLEIWCNDEIEFSKSRAVSYIYELLKEKPEQEANLLRLLINKLGDPVKKIASQASYLIMQLLGIHPAMKDVVIGAIESDFIFRPGQSMHGKYYAVVTINQTALSSNEEALASKLLGVYFGLFKPLLQTGRHGAEEPKEILSQTRKQRQHKKKSSEPQQSQGEELREKLISAILTGVNRAYPYTGSDHQAFNEHLDTLYQITHSANFNTGVQAMMLIQQLTSATQSSADRFYKTLYESLLDARLATSSKQQLYLNLLHRALKSDLNLKRVKAFVKRILQVLSLHEPPFICGIFFLLKDLEKTFPSLTSMLDQAEDKDDDEEAFRDVGEDAVQPAEQHVRFPVKSAQSYDAQKRAPEYAQAENACAWEVLPYLAHFHPSVAVSADHMLDHTPLPGKPDLSLHTLIHFLDRFVYRNPKLSVVKLRGSSVMQPMANDDTHSVLFSQTTFGSSLPVNSEEFRNKRDGEVAAADVFFHQYFKALGKGQQMKARKKVVAGDDAGSIGSDEEDEVWKAMMDSAPDLGEIDEDDDLSMSDLSDFAAAMGSEDEKSLAGDVDNDDEDGEQVDIEPGIFDDADVGVIDDDAESGGDTEIEDEVEFGGLDSGISSDESSSDEASTPKSSVAQKRKEDRERRKKLKALPTFASMSEYAQMLEGDEDEDLG